MPEGLGDAGRALTARARLAIVPHFEALAPQLKRAQLIFTSPLVRAVQTAQLLAVAVKHEGPLRAHRCLLPEVPVGAIESVLDDQNADALALVGHQPSMGALAAHLLGLT